MLISYALHTALGRSTVPIVEKNVISLQFESDHFDGCEDRRREVVWIRYVLKHGKSRIRAKICPPTVDRFGRCCISRSRQLPKSEGFTTNCYY